MIRNLAYHFHGYQPGDIVFRKEKSPMRSMEFLERYSPVSILLDDTEIKGKNWTDTVLESYEYVVDTLEPLIRTHKICSIDIEPYTLLMLLQKKPTIYKKLEDLFIHIDLIPTIPFHPIMPHLHPIEQQVLTRVAFQFFKPFIYEKSIVGFWFPECAYSASVGRIIAEIFYKKFNDKQLFFVLDARQVDYKSEFALWSCNYLNVDNYKVGIFVRDFSVSDMFAFRTNSVKDIVNCIMYKKTDIIKNKLEVPYLLTLSSDIESLISASDQPSRFKEFVNTLLDHSVIPIANSEYLHRKLTGEYKRWEGEFEHTNFKLEIRDNSSWSDYPDMMVNCKTSDTRWTGIRRLDGLVFSRKHKNKDISQIWKQGYTIMFNQLNDYVRMNVIHILKELSNCTNVINFLVEYNKIIFRDYYERLGYTVDFENIVERTLGTVDDIQIVACAGRAYYEMLMANRSCPRFWNNIDTRVTFQSIVLMSHSLIDLIKIYLLLGDSTRAFKTFSLYLKNLVGFEHLYHIYNLNLLHGLVGWETLEDSWFAAIQSEIPDISAYNVVKRAAIYVGMRELPSKKLVEFEKNSEKIFCLIEYYDEEVVADTAHISGEMFGIWANKIWCENKR